MNARMTRSISIMLMLLLTASFASLAAAAPPPQDEQPSIVDIAVEDGRFTTLVTALEAAGLVDTLQGDGPYTVFAPTDEAFSQLPEGTVEGLLEDVPVLTEVLLYHVVPGKVMAADVVNLDTTATLLGEPLTVSVTDGVVMINDAQVTITDLEGSNGVIHVIDSVLLPPAVAGAMDDTAAEEMPQPQAEDSGDMATEEGSEESADSEMATEESADGEMATEEDADGEMATEEGSDDSASAEPKSYDSSQPMMRQPNWGPRYQPYLHYPRYNYGQRYNYGYNSFPGRAYPPRFYAPSYNHCYGNCYKNYQPYQRNYSGYHRAW